MLLTTNGQYECVVTGLSLIMGLLWLHSRRHLRLWQGANALSIEQVMLPRYPIFQYSSLGLQYATASFFNQEPKSKADAEFLSCLCARGKICMAIGGIISMQLGFSVRPMPMYEVAMSRATSLLSLQMLQNTELLCKGRGQGGGECSS